MKDVCGYEGLYMGRRWLKKHITTAIMLREYSIVVANSIYAPFAEKN